MAKSTISRARRNTPDAAARSRLRDIVTDPARLAAIRDRATAGLNRALADAVGVAKGTVNKYLREMDLAIDRTTGRLVPRDPDADAVEELLEDFLRLVILTARVDEACPDDIHAAEPLLSRAIDAGMRFAQAAAGVDLSRDFIH